MIRRFSIWLAALQCAAAAPIAKPLAAPSRQVGDTMFERLEPQKVGIDFVREWRPPEEWAGEISGSFTGGGVCLGDFDNDGDADVFFSRMTDGGRLYRNLGDFRFEDVTDRAGRDVAIEKSLERRLQPGQT